MRGRSAVKFTRKVIQLRRGLVLARCSAIDLFVASKWVQVSVGATCAASLLLLAR